MQGLGICVLVPAPALGFLLVVSGCLGESLTEPETKILPSLYPTAPSYPNSVLPISQVTQNLLAVSLLFRSSLNTNSPAKSCVLQVHLIPGTSLAIV